MSEFFASGLGWEAARGITTLAIALPCLLFFVVVLGISTRITTLATLATFLVFAILGSRDLLRVFRTLRDPEAVQARLDKAQPDSIDPWKNGKALGPPSVTEHTTFRLEDPARDRDDSQL
jgi:hypothetical protein